jgi:hypothetical protein
MLRPIRGTFRDRHERWVRRAMGVRPHETSAASTYGKIVWSCHPDAGDKPADDRLATVATKPGSPGRARDKPSNHRAGNVGCFGVPVVTNSRDYLVTREAAGAFDAPAFPAPSIFRRVNICKSPARFALWECVVLRTRLFGNQVRDADPTSTISAPAVSPARAAKC